MELLWMAVVLGCFVLVVLVTLLCTAFWLVCRMDGLYQRERLDRHNLADRIQTVIASEVETLEAQTRESESRSRAYAEALLRD
jgi:hypothetical protein